MRIDRIMVGIDGSEHSRAALAWAAAEARLHDARLIVAIASGIPPVALVPGGQPSWENLSRHTRTEVEAILASVDTDGLDVERRVLEGPASSALIKASRDADLLAVGSRGRRGVKAAALGSVSQHCLAHAHCPVAVIPG